MTHRQHNPLAITTVLLLAAVALTLPIYYFGMPGGNDLPQHFRFIHAFYDATQNGNLYPSWPGDTNLGFGDVGVRFYPPLAYYVVALFRSVTQSWTTALAAAICFWFFVGGIGAFLLARESFSERASVIAALVFMAMPYHANQVYNAGLFAEFAGLAILPFCFLFVGRTVSYGRMFDIAGLSVAYTLLILAHLPLAVMGSFGLLVYALAMLGRNLLGVTTLKLGSAVIAALAASAFYWVRMVAELGLVNHNLPQYTGGTYDFRLNFLAAILYLPTSEYAETSAWFTDLLFAITFVMVVPAAVVFFTSHSAVGKLRIRPLICVLAVAIFMATPLSIWIWTHVGILAKIQFPWRFLGLISLVGSILIAAGIDELPALFRTRLRPIGLITIGMIAAGIVFTFAQVIRPATYPSREEFDVNFERYRSDESYECWWPVWADRRALGVTDKVATNSRSVEPVTWTPTDRSVIVHEGTGDRLRVATFYYPLWDGTINGEPAKVEPAEDGTISIAIPDQRSNVRLFFSTPSYEVASRYVSLGAWLLLIAGLVVPSVNRLKRRDLV